MKDFAKFAYQKQAEYRAEGHDISQNGKNPNDRVSKENGHVLANGYSIENLYPLLREGGVAHEFFRSRRIHWWSQGFDAANCNTRNLASSQLCCVNFLLPHAEDESTCTAILKAIDPDIERALPIQYDGFSSFVELEWIGRPTCLEGGVGQRGKFTTSSDALMLGQTKSGENRAYVFEWKYLEEYVKENDISKTGSNETRRKNYQPLLAEPDSSFVPDTVIDELFFEPFYQLMRLRLLGDLMVRRNELGVTEAKVIVVCPKENEDYRTVITSQALRTRFPKATSVQEVFRELLKDPAGFAVTSQEHIIRCLRQSSVSEKLGQWFEYHAERYGWYSGSQK